MTLPKLIIWTACAALGMTLTSCNTFLGFGRDLQQAGQGIEKTVYGNKTQEQPQAYPAQ